MPAPREPARIGTVSPCLTEPERYTLPVTGSEHDDTPRDGGGAIMRIAFAVGLHLHHIKPIVVKTTFKQRRHDLESFVRHVGPNMAVKAIKPQHIQGWLAGMDVRASTLHQRCGTIRYFYRDAITHGWAKADPTSLIQLPRRPKKQPRSLTQEELRALGHALPDARARLIIALAINEALRRIEICRLELDDIDLRTMTIRLVTAKSMTEDSIPLTIDTHSRFLLPYLIQRGMGAGPLIRSYKDQQGLSPSYLTSLVGQWFVDAGIKEAPYDGRSLHAGRHTAASIMLEAGAPPTVVQKALRHASLQSTWTYMRHRRTVEEIRPWMGLQPDPIPDEAA